MLHADPGFPLDVEVSVGGLGAAGAAAVTEVQLQAVGAASHVLLNERQRIADDLGTAVNVQTMVFGNKGDDSGTGVAFTRNTFDGTKELYGEYLVNAQGEDVVAGIRTPEPIAHLKDTMPEAYDEFVRIGNQLEAHYRDVQDLEFTIERGKLYMLQTRDAKRTAAAAVKIACDMVSEKLITPEDAVARIRAHDLNQPLFLYLAFTAPHAPYQAPAGAWAGLDGFVCDLCIR